MISYMADKQIAMSSESRREGDGIYVRAARGTGRGINCSHRRHYLS